MEDHGIDLVKIVVLLGAGVIAVPIFTRLKLGSVLAYFMAGMAIGPFGFGLFGNPTSMLHVAEFGVIMLLFIIGLEMNPARLWSLRRDILGLGAAQVLTCGLLLTCAGYMAGLSIPVAFIAGMGFVLSSTAVVMQMLDERGETSTPFGHKAVSVLLFEDLSIVPLLALVALIGTQAVESASEQWTHVALGIASIVGLIAAGRWLLNPMFRILAAAHAREVMTAAALLVVLGSALLMEWGGLSMAMGAFMAGVLLSTSTFRHQLEADIEPFRGILLGLFFMSVGMTLDLPMIAEQWKAVLAGVIGYTLIKSAGIYIVARGFKAPHRDALRRVAMFAQGGEFAFVLYAAAQEVGLVTDSQVALFTAIVILSMILTPLLARIVDRLLPEAPPPSMDGIEEPDGLEANVLMIGFGRFGQVVSQSLLARGFHVSIIESNIDLIRTASSFGFKVYYGDGTRLDVLKASGADKADAILVCVGQRDISQRIATLVRAEFPLTTLFVNSYDRGQSIDLIRLGVDYQLRETFESAMRFGRDALVALGVSPDEADVISQDVRERDAARLDLQVAGDLKSGADYIINNNPLPAPLTKPQREGDVVNHPDIVQAAQSVAVAS